MSCRTCHQRDCDGCSRPVTCPRCTPTAIGELCARCLYAVRREAAFAKILDAEVSL